MAAPEIVRTIHFGVGAPQRRRAAGYADELWAAGQPARALFKPALGGWVVVVYRARDDGSDRSAR